MAAAVEPDYEDAPTGCRSWAVSRYVSLWQDRDKFRLHKYIHNPDGSLDQVETEDLNRGQVHYILHMLAQARMTAEQVLAGKGKTL